MKVQWQVREGEVAETLKLLGSGFAADVADVVKGGPVDIYSAVVSSQFDADRLDYMQRDRLMTGSQHAEIDFVWLISNLKVREIGRGVDEAALDKIPTFVLGPKSVYAAESYVLGLFQLYPTIYFHKATRGAEKLFSELLARTVTLARNGDHRLTGLPKKHPIIRFSDASDDVESLLRLDDTVIWGALHLMVGASDKVIAELADRLLARRLYKSINVRERIRSAVREADVPAVELAACTNRACAAVGVRISDLVSDRADGVPVILWDEAQREPYKELDESKGPLNQIMIETLEGELVDLRTRSPVVDAIETFRLARAYIQEDDDETKAWLTNAISEEVRNALN